ncbi:glycosyltransferase [Loktanella sp. F6476L]|uniref:glycosyltransferase n=1 Tax=Loktanella sp. F6476L TaxID=2926405 RepID=UPI001FF325E0|nr:glycosyltransferase [Loktanella sp. F6476L]MCK0122131.1 glycosyltransferase [Loktanella sp. F6476L]
MTSTPLRVCFVIQKLLGLSGGAERVFVETAQAMAARGIDVEILIYDNGAGRAMYETNSIVVKNLFPFRRPNLDTPRTNNTPSSIKKLPHGHIMGHVKWGLTHELFIRTLRRHLQRHPPDVVVGFLPPAITACVRAAAPLSIPVIASIHNLPEQDFGNSIRWDQNPIYRRRAKKALTDADAVTVLLEDFRDWFPAQQQPYIHVIPNAVARVSPQDDPRPTRQKTILAVGRLTDVKRFDLLVDAWTLLHTDFPDWQVKIYGEGPNHNALNSQISASKLGSSIQLCGTTPQLGPIYDQASIFCHPAAFEGFGLVVAEAMAHGLPVVGFEHCTGVNTLIQDGINGQLVGGSAKELSDGLRRYIENPKNRQNAGKAALSIGETYAPEIIYTQWETLLRELSLKRQVF